MLLLKKKKYAAVTMEKKANGDIVCHTELKGTKKVFNDVSNTIVTFVTMSTIAD